MAREKSKLMQTLTAATILVSILLVVLIAIQEQSADTPGVFGGSTGGGSYHTRRGLERFIFGATVALTGAFIALSIASLVASAS